MPQKEVKGMLSEAEAIEKDRYLMYRQKSRQVISPEARHILKFLEKAEKRHLMLLRRQKRFPKRKIDAGLSKSMVFRAAEGIKKENGSFIGDINVLKLAKKLESVDCPYYGKLAGKTSQKNIKSLLLELQKQECMHLRIITKKLREMQMLGVALSRAQNPRFSPILQSARLSR